VPVVGFPNLNPAIGHMTSHIISVSGKFEKEKPPKENFSFGRFNECHIDIFHPLL
jgi:hypothetical protein